MYQNLTYRLERIRERSDEGFTLIELLVVLLIIGILLGIAIPTFLSVTKSASNTAVESNLQTALTGADAAYTQNSGTYTYSGTGLATALSGEDTGLTFATGASTGPSNMSYAQEDVGGSGQSLVLAAWSGSTGKCYAVADIKLTAVPSGTPDTTNLTSAVGADNVSYGYFTTTQGNCTAGKAYAGIAAPGGAPGTGSWQTGGFPS